MSQIIRYILQFGWKFILELCYPTNDTLVPISKDLKRSPKLLWINCGLVNYVSNVQKEMFGAKDILDAYFDE
jgi:hypothetical protein